MEREYIAKSLGKRFAEANKPGEKRKIIFWYDPDKQFADLIEGLKLTNAKIHRLTETNYFRTKYILEAEDPDSNYLIYADHKPMRDQDNWLLDTLLYSQEFSADRLLMHMEEIGINVALKSQVKRYEKFFNNAERRKKLASCGVTAYDEASLEIAMMSVLCGNKYADQLDVFKKVLGESLDEAHNRYLMDIYRFMDEQVFWKHAGRFFGYTKEASLRKLAAHILINSLSRTLGENYLAPLKEYLAEKGRANCIYFVDQWMNHKTDSASFETLSSVLDSSLNISDRLGEVPIEAMGECDAFESFDKKTLRFIIESIVNDVDNYELCLELIKNRRTRYWYGKYGTIYEALFYAISILQYKKDCPNISVQSSSQLWQSYTDIYYRIDNYYRHFYWYYDQNPVEALKPVRSIIENLYSNWFLNELGIAWSSALEEQGEAWGLDGVIGQQSFYDKEIAPAIRAGDRLFVIIVDALRYEAAVDIAHRLKTETSGEVTLDTMLGVLPSATKYGMAALLPHQQLSLNEKGRVLADGKSTEGVEGRAYVLNSAVIESIAMDFHQILSMTKEERREYVKGKKLVYIYHDSIDLISHTAEINAFNAVQQSMEEIMNLVRIIRNDLSGVNILITSDHGFIYKRDPLLESDKINKETVDAFEEKRRYMLSHKVVPSDAVMRFKPDFFKCDGDPVLVYVPRANIRFKVQGAGANFVHGGATLQEVVVPLIKYKVVRGSDTKIKEQRKVKVKLVTEMRKITNNLFSLEFFQTEKADALNIPRTVEIYLEDDAGRVLTSRERIIADKNSDKPAERTYKIRFTLKTGKYDKNQDYYLVIRDVDTELIEDKIPFKISLAISSDFNI